MNFVVSFLLGMLKFRILNISNGNLHHLLNNTFSDATVHKFSILCELCQMWLRVQPQQGWSHTDINITVEKCKQF